ncbi:MAG: hypothetical protein ABF295_10830 [Flavobacteriaceae bacterium]
MKRKDNYEKWTSEQLTRQVKNLKLTTGLLAGILLLLFAITIYNTIKEGQFDPLMISPIALSIIIPLNIKRMREIKVEIQRREKE